MPRITPFDRANAEGVLGDALHAQKRYAEAFRAYEASNAETRRIHAQRYARPGVETIPQYLDWMIAYFTRRPASGASTREQVGAEDADRPAQHIFIVGFPRSGTTLVENILGCLPGAVTTDEKDGFGDAVRDFMATPTGLDRLGTADHPTISRYRQTYWQRMRRHGLDHRNRIFLDKNPYHTIKLPLVASLFPEARVVFTIRDPRDVVLSCVRRQLRMNPSNFELLTLVGAAKFYDQTMRLADLYRSRLPLVMRHVRHEDIVSNFDHETQTLCDFLGVPWSAEMRSFENRARSSIIATASANQVMKGLSRGGLEQWRHYEKQLAPALPILAPWVERFGYAVR